MGAGGIPFHRWSDGVPAPTPGVAGQLTDGAGRAAGPVGRVDPAEYGAEEGGAQRAAEGLEEPDAGGGHAQLIGGCGVLDQVDQLPHELPETDAHQQQRDADRPEAGVRGERGEQCQGGGRADGAADDEGLLRPMRPW